MTEHLYYADSFLTEFDAEVIEVQELSRQDGQSLWRIALNQTAFYPTSGGQPYDTGYLVATARSGAELRAQVTGVEEDDSGEVWHHLRKPFATGTHVHGSVDADRRLDHIQQHSGQHLLSAVFFQICGARTVSFHLGEEVSTVDLAVDDLTRQTCIDAEELANRMVAEDRPVTTRIVARDQAERWLASGEMQKLPARQGDLRIVEIAGDSVPLDRNACGGTHVRSTGQIGGVRIRRVERAGTVWRVEFVCGLRLIRAARFDFETLGDSARHLSAGLAEVPDAIVRLQAELKQAGRRIEAQQADLADYRAAELVRKTPLENGRRILQLQLTPPETADPQQAKRLVAKITVQAGYIAVAAAWSPASADENPTLIFAQTGDLDLDCGAVLRQALDAHSGRGGGTKTMAQGSIRREFLSSTLETLIAAVQGAPAINREPAPQEP